MMTTLFKLLCATSTRGKMKWVLQGDFMRLMPAITINRDDQRVRGDL